MRKEEPGNQFRFREFRFDENGEKIYTQLELAERLNMTRNRIAELETKETVCPPAHEIQAYCTAFGTTSDYLLFGIGAKNRNVSDPESIDTACRVTGLSQDAITILHENRQHFQTELNKAMLTQVTTGKQQKRIDGFSWMLNTLLKLDGTQPDGLIRLIYLFVTGDATGIKDGDEPWTLTDSSDPLTRVSRSKADVVRAFLPNMIQEKLVEYREKIKKEKEQ